MTSVERAIEYSRLLPETQILQGDDGDDCSSREASGAAESLHKPRAAVPPGGPLRLATVRSGDSEAAEQRMPPHWPDAGGIVLSVSSKRAVLVFAAER